MTTTTTTTTTTTATRVLTLTCPHPACRREIARAPYVDAEQRAVAHAWLLGIWRLHAAGRRHPFLLALIAERAEGSET